jgi:valyl-tRNA synthetase
VTEEIWQRLPRDGGAPPSIMVSAFPQPDRAKMDAAAEGPMQRLRRLVTEIRIIRAAYEVEPRRRIDVTVVAPSAEDRGFVTAHAALLKDLARVERFEVVPEVRETPRTIKHPVDALELRIPMAGLFDIAAEKGRLAKETLKVEAELEGLRGRLGNPRFVERAKPEVVAHSRERVAELEARRAKIGETLRELGG